MDDRRTSVGPPAPPRRNEFFMVTNVDTTNRQIPAHGRPRTPLVRTQVSGRSVDARRTLDGATAWVKYVDNPIGLVVENTRTTPDPLVRLTPRRTPTPKES